MHALVLTITFERKKERIVKVKVITGKDKITCNKEGADYIISMIQKGWFPVESRRVDNDQSDSSKALQRSTRKWQTT